ncbi:MAG: hypothetical protein ACTSXV_01010, partial [Alphaproteobacteria bacterium]
MKTEDVLNEFVKKSLSEKVVPAKIEKTLRENGWSSREINKALGNFNLTKGFSFPVPVKNSVSLSSFFVFLAFNICFLWSFGAFTSVMFDYLNFAFPEGLSDYKIKLDIIFEISTLIVFLP